MARIVRHNDESVRQEYIMNGGKEVKLFTRALKAFQCNNRIVMAQGKHLDDFLRGGIIGRLECGRTQLEVSEELGIAQSVFSRLWQLFQDDGNVSRCYSTGLPQVTTPNEDRIFGSYCQKKQTEHSIRHVSSALFSYRYDSFKADRVPVTTKRTPLNDTVTVVQDDSRVWGGIILDSRTDLHVQSVTMTGHIYRDVILEQHVRLFRGAMGAEFLFMDDNARPHRANIVDECLQSEDITCMDWPAYSPDSNPIEHV
ncbi:transposable element Tcb2 transposase [Trichonephila clavipes]|nr:transposable element Tcb2 transposase [Trichonephila clavipes]